MCLDSIRLSIIYVVYITCIHNIKYMYMHEFTCELC